MTSTTRNLFILFLPLFLQACGGGDESTTNINPSNTTQPPIISTQVTSGPSDSIPALKEQTVTTKSKQSNAEIQEVSLSSPQGIHIKTIDKKKYVYWDAYSEASHYNIYLSNTDNADGFHLIDSVDSNEKLQYPIEDGEFIYITAGIYGDESPPSLLVSSSNHRTFKVEDIIPD